MAIELASSDNKSPLVVQVMRPVVYPRHARAFFESLAFALLMCWSPSNVLGYLAPVVALTWYIVRSRSRRALIGGATWFTGWIIVICLWVLFSREFVFSNAVLAILTYSAFAVLLIISPGVIVDRQLWNSTLRLLSWVVYLEGSLGIVQAVYGFTNTGSFYGPNGDYVEGTIHPWLPAELAFSNPMFAVNMTFMLLTLTPSVILRRKYLLSFLIGLLALVLASVLHVLYLLLGALLIMVALYYPSILKHKSGLLMVAIGVIFASIAFSIVGFRIDATRNFFRANLEGRTPRGVVLDYAFDEMPREYRLLPLFGIGPGQFSSRAGLIGSGFYFGRPERPRTVPFIPAAMSPAFRKYVLDAWLYLPRAPGMSSSSTQPYFSWLSVYVEFGAVMCAFIVFGVVYLLLRLRRYARTPVLRVHTIVLGTGILLLFLLGLQENYWEIPQAIFVGLLLLKFQYANLRVQYQQWLGRRYRFS